MDRLALSLAALRSQINAAWPKRSKISDGWIGDKAHASRKSDHNPLNGVVHALDITHDPANGPDGWALANALLATKDKRISYIISNGKIAAGRGGPNPWVWRKYLGENPHTHHMHISAVEGPIADDSTAWAFDKPAKSPDAPKVTVANPVLRLGAKGDAVKQLQAALNAKGAKLTVDGDFGKKTEAALIAFQKANKLHPDGVAGPYTFDALI